MKGSKLAEYVRHQLNVSPSKQACSFGHSARFPPPNSHSPNKYYHPPGKPSVSKGYSIGSSHPTPTLHPTPSPDKYHITSQFNPTPYPNRQTSFGISREEAYCPNQIQPGPGSYNLPPILGNKPFYMGQKPQRTQSMSDLPGATRYTIRSDSLSRLSNHRSSGKVRIKTEYYPKPLLAPYDNKVPGPDQYHPSKGRMSTSKGKKTTFGVGQRMKSSAQGAVGPGSYNIFSEFGPFSGC